MMAHVVKEALKEQAKQADKLEKHQRAVTPPAKWQPDKPQSPPLSSSSMIELILQQQDNAAKV